VILLGVDASAFAAKTIEKLSETLQDAVSFSSIIAEMESTCSVGSLEDRESWEVTITKKDNGKAPSIDSFTVHLSADIGESQIGLSWTHWAIRGKQ
jgi:hypothetical protein